MCSEKDFTQANKRSWWQTWPSAPLDFLEIAFDGSPDIFQIRIVFIFHFVYANLFPPLSWEINSVEADDPSLVTASPDPTASDWSVCKLKISKSFAGTPKQFFIWDPRNLILIRNPLYDKLQIGFFKILCRKTLYLCTCHKKSLDLPHHTNSFVNWKYQNSLREIHKSSG